MYLMRTLHALALAAVLAGCSTTSQSYVVDSSDYSAVRGEIVSIENLDAGEFRHLEDGVAIVLNGSGCRVTIRFDEDVDKVFDVGEGAILVFGEDCDYLLRSEVD